MPIIIHDSDFPSTPDHSVHYSMDMVAPGISAAAVLADAHSRQLSCMSGQTVDIEDLDSATATLANA